VNAPTSEAQESAVAPSLVVSDNEENISEDANQKTPTAVALVSTSELASDVVVASEVTVSLQTDLTFLASAPVTGNKEDGITLVASPVAYPIISGKENTSNAHLVLADNSDATVSHQNTVVEFYDVGFFGDAPAQNDAESIFHPIFSIDAIIDSDFPFSQKGMALSPVMLALKYNEERVMETALVSGFVYIHGSMAPLFSLRDEWSGRVTDTLLAQHRAHILATVSAGSRSGQEDRQQKQGQDDSALYQLWASV
jgi:hypothetical protein